jgi:hypothetical protein
MEHRVKVTVLDKKLFPELQAKYCAVPDSQLKTRFRICS